MDGQYNPYSFISSDVVVWNGMLTSFGAIAPFAMEGDSLRIANEIEEAQHKDAPHTLPYVN